MIWESIKYIVLHDVTHNYLLYSMSVMCFLSGNMSGYMIEYIILWY